MTSPTHRVVKRIYHHQCREYARGHIVKGGFISN